MVLSHSIFKAVTGSREVICQASHDKRLTATDTPIAIRRSQVSWYLISVVETTFNIRGPLYKHDLTLIPPWESNHMSRKV